MQFAFNLVQLLCLPLMSRAPCVLVSYVSRGLFPRRAWPARLPVLMC